MRDSASPTASESESTRLTSAQWMTLLAAFLGWMFDGLEMGIFPLAGRVALKDMLGPDVTENTIGQWFGAITALFLIGAAVGGLIFGWLGDRVGRVRAMAASILVYSLFTGACYFANAPWQLAALRFVASIGMGGEWSLGAALVMECWPSSARPMLAGVIGSASNVGFLAISLLGKYQKVTTDSWRWVMLAGAAPAFLTFFIRLFVPESERWQAAKRADASPIREVFGPTLLKTTLLAIAFGSIALIGTWGSVQWIPTWVEHMAGGTDLEKASAKADVAISSSAGAIIGCFVGSLLGGRIGRRPVYFGLCLSSLIVTSWMYWTYVEYDPSIIWVAGLVGLLTAAFYGWLPLYLPELYPTRIRATGQGVAFNFGRFIAAGCVLGAGRLVAAFGDYGTAGSIVCLVYSLGLFLIWLAPETRGKPMPD